MEQEFLDKLEAMDLKVRAPTVEKGLLDLPADLMYEVFGPLDARSLLETANSHQTLREHVVNWPGKAWEIVYRSDYELVIDYEVFSWEDEMVLLEKARYKEEHSSPGTGASTNICDLPYDLLWQIMDPLYGNQVMALAKCHPHLLRATRGLRTKYFHEVNISAEVFLLSGTSWLARQNPLVWTHLEAEVLLSGADVRELRYDVLADIAPDMRVRKLRFEGSQEMAYKCAELVNKWKPEKIDFPHWNAEAFNSNPELPRALKNVGRLNISVLTVEWLSYIPDWDFCTLKFRLDSEGRNATRQLTSMFQKLYDQWIAFERDGIDLEIYGKSHNIRSFEVNGISLQPGIEYRAKRSDCWVLTCGYNALGYNKMAKRGNARRTPREVRVWMTVHVF